MTSAWLRRTAGRAAIVTLASIDLARPAGQTQSFTPAGSIPGPVDQVHVQGRFAYLAANQEFKIFDLSQQQAPRIVGTYAFPEKIWGFRVHPPLVYVAVDFFGLGIVDISDPARPTLRGSIKTPGQAKAVTVVGATALLTDHVSGVDFVDIANTAKPASLGSFFLDGYARDVTSAGTTAYAVDSPTGLYVFDLSKPFDLSKDEPFEPVASQQSVTGSRVIDVAPARGPSGVHLAVMTGGPELQVYDVANPKTPRKLASFPVPGGTQRADLRGSLAYVAAGPEGLQVVDLSTPAKPKIIAAYKTPSPARDVSVAEDGFVFVAMGKIATRYQGDGEVVILRRNP